MKDEVALSGAERLLRSRMKVRGVLWIETRWKSQVSQQQQTIQFLLRAFWLQLSCPALLVRSGISAWSVASLQKHHHSTTMAVADSERVAVSSAAHGSEDCV